jgi:hypothetical protein
MLLFGEQLPQTLIRRLSDSFINSSDKIEHHEDDLETGLNQLIPVVFATEHRFAGIVDIVVGKDSLQEPQDGSDEFTPILDLNVQIFNVESIFFIIDEGVSVDAERLVVGWLRRLWDLTCSSGLRSISSLVGISPSVRRIGLSGCSRDYLVILLRLFYDNLRVIFIDFFIDADDLLSYCYDLLESIIESYGTFVPIFRYLKHEKSLISFVLMFERNQ